MQKETVSEAAYTTILKDNDMPESYRVELIDTKTGECHVNIFSGGNAELRAKFFMSSYYPDVKINEMPDNGVKPTAKRARSKSRC